MKITPAGHAPSRPDPADWFTGRVRIDPLFNPDAPDRVRGVHVASDPSARTTRHTLSASPQIITEGLWCCPFDVAPVRTIRPGEPPASPPANATGTMPPTRTACRTFASTRCRTTAAQTG